MGLTKAQLEALNISSFPDNNSELITPEILRTFNSASIANTVNQDTYTTDSASFDSRIDAIVTGTGFVTTQSFNDYTASNDQAIASLESNTGSVNSSISQLNASSASQQLSINALNTFTASANISITDLNVSSASQQAQINSLISATGSYSTSSVSLTSLNAYTASNDTKWNNLAGQSGSWITESETGSFATSAITASSLITASVTGQTLTFTKGDSSTFNVTLPTGSGGTTDITALNEFTSSQLVINTGYNTATASLNSSVSQLNANTASQQSQIDSLIAATGSYSTSSTDITSLNAYTASNDTKWSNLGLQSGSWITESETGSFAISSSVTTAITDLSASLTVTDEFLQSQIDALDPSGSAASLALLNEFTASQLLINDGYNTFTQSITAEVDSLQAATASYALSASVALVDANQQAQIDSLISATGSYSTSSTDITSLNQFTQSADSRLDNLESATSSYATSAITASSVVAIQATPNELQFSYTLGDGNALNTVTLVAPAGSDITSLNQFTASQELLNNTFATTGSNSFNGDQTITGSLLVTGNTFVTPALASNNVSYPLVFISASTITKDSIDTVMYNPSTNVLQVSGSNGFSSMTQFGVNYTSITSSIISSLSKGFVASTDSTGAPTTFKAIQISANPSVTQNPSVATITNPSILTPSSSVGGFIAPIQFQDRSGFTDGRVTFTTPIAALSNVEITGSLTASLQQGYVWVGDANGKTITVATSSFFVSGSGPTDITALNSFTASQELLNTTFATTGSNTFVDNQIVNADLSVSSSRYLRIGDLQSLSQGVSTTGLRIASQNGNTIINETAGDINIENQIGDIYNRGNRAFIIATTDASVSGSRTFIQDVEFIPFSSSLNSRILAITGSGGTVDTGSFATTGSNSFNGNQIITGSLIISSSAVNDLIVSGNMVMGGFSNPSLLISSSTGNSQIQLLGGGGAIVVTSGSAPAQTLTQSGMTRTSISHTGNPGYVIGISGKPSLQGGGWISFGNNKPTIYANRQGGNYGVIELENSQSYTDGRVTILTPLVATLGSEFSGSTTFKGNITFQDRSGNFGNVILGNNALGMGSAGPQPDAIGNTIAIAIGNGAMRYASGSSQNIAIGTSALSITTGSNNVAIGSESMPNNTTGFSNVAIGVNSLNMNTEGNSNFALGINSLQNNTTGNSNIAIGKDSGRDMIGASNTMIGESAGKFLSGSGNTIIGGYQSDTGSALFNNIILADGFGNARARYNDNAWSLDGGIKLNKGSNKPADIVTVGSSGTTVSNSLVTADSIILLTTQNSSVAGNEYPAVVSTKGTGTFDIAHGYGGNLLVGYLIINPTT